MNTKCACGKFRLGEAWTLDQCRRCWLYAHDGPFRKYWGGDDKTTFAPRRRISHVEGKLPVDHGPGTELKKLLEMLGIEGQAGCDCNSKARQMNEWGVAGCRERREEIAGWLRANAKERGWKEKAKAAALATAQGIAFQLDWSDLYGSLVDLAIKRAEESHP